MRLSMDRDDRAYDRLRCITAKIFLDGVEQKRCLTADEEEGICILYPTDSDGQSNYQLAIIGKQ